VKKARVTVGFSCALEVVCRGIETGAAGSKLNGVIELELGGTSFNVAVALSQAGFSPHLVATIGGHDEFAPIVRQKLKATGIEASLFPVRKRTPVSLLLPEKKWLLTDRRGMDRPLRAAELEELHRHAAPTRVVTGLLPDADEVKIARALFRHQTPDRRLNILNPRASLVVSDLFDLLLPQINWLVLNREESEFFFGLGSRVDQFLHRHNTVLVVTRDTEGAQVLTGGARYRIPAYPDIAVVQETGAGDCFLGYFLASYLQKMPWQMCLKRAVVAAGLKVSRPGSASAPERHEVDVCVAGWHEEVAVDSVT